jgi:hypothetical protein
LSSVANFLNTFLAPSFAHIWGAASMQVIEDNKDNGDNMVLDVMWQHSAVLNPLYTCK